MSYHHLTAPERCHIYELHVQKMTVIEIAEQVGRDKSTISRELRRNRGQRGYRPGQADSLARARQINCASGPRVSPAVWEAVQGKLQEDWIPQHIAGRFAIDGTGQISTQTIYDFILVDKQAGDDLYVHLHSQKKRRKKYGSGPSKRGSIPDRVGIEERPKIVNKKVRVGDWQSDLIVGKGNKQAIVSLVDRKSRFTLLHKVEGKQSKKSAAPSSIGCRKLPAASRPSLLITALIFLVTPKLLWQPTPRFNSAALTTSGREGLTNRQTVLCTGTFPKVRASIISQLMTCAE